MDYITVKECAKLWNISERTVRNYCANGRIEGAYLVGKTWNIPVGSTQPQRTNKRRDTQALLTRLIEEKKAKISGGIYHEIQVDLTYNSNHIEGSKLTHDQTRFIFETNTIGAYDEAIKVDDIVETTNHFRAIDYVIDNATKPLNEHIIKELHRILKTATTDATLSWFVVGDYKKLPNQIGGNSTTMPEDVNNAMRQLLTKYNSISKKTFDDLIEFHYQFECIHPFQDGNGRVGRLILFKECLANNIVPFIISEDLKFYYYRGLHEWTSERGYLTDTMLTAQDRFKKILDYYKIEY